MNFDKSQLADVVKNVKRFKNWTYEQRNILLGKLGEEIGEKGTEINKIVTQLCYDRKFCRDIGINYSNILEEDFRLIKTAIVDYLLGED